MERPFKKRQHEDRILGEVNRILRSGVSDRRLRLVSATKVELNSDRSKAVVFWDTFDPARRGDSKKAIEGMAGKARTLLARSLGTRRTPRIVFRYDSRYESERRIESLLAAPPKDAPEEA